ncbi:endonuclease VII domain-containing protein [Streptomyces sp. NBC_00006]|uniref:endonuclease VII domain-containing protein n=1 Tax=Streptomyces sp. NBC_00006 TaxID=2975619 RepID=UPI00225A23EA|nr:endonuclease VII domain-containing protein [Streptomyces sp. NBC_00006]MCX5537705.1 endonuclease VII domain-containing protein [Streptomyces sp. NBC_00006]MCX5537884.1 endonuclease VII domain-containing protein [Streptomyces sp. NBC_00006]
MDEIEYQTCADCSESLPLSEFHRNGRGGHLSRCRPCRAATRKAWRENNRVRQAAHRRRFQLARYGLTEDEYGAMLEEQGGVCAMCRETCSTGRQLAVDHDHVTGVVRGLLCQKCNRGLGAYEAMRRSAEQYLATYGAGNPHISHGEALETRSGEPRPRISAATQQLTDGDIVRMRERYAQGGVTQRALASEYGLSQNAVGLILRRITWTHVA